jgi:hypothetical protein
MADKPMTKLLTFQSWVTRAEWYDYARKNPLHVPYMLTDRSPCQDPFFDHYAPSRQDRRPLISGLCRCLKNFQPGDRFLYVTKIDPAVGSVFGIRPGTGRPYYFGVAALVVQRVWESHATAARSFTSRRFVVAPTPTPYPPNLAHERHPAAAVARESCIVHDVNKKAHTPLHSDDTNWRTAYLAYHLRQRGHALRTAECKVELVGELEALQLSPDSAPVFTPADWGDLTMTIGGRWIEETQAASLRARIAHGVPMDRDALVPAPRQPRCAVLTEASG